MFSVPIKLFAAIIVLVSPSILAEDWPQFLGPNRNLKTTYPDLNLNWPNGQPIRLWQATIGRGWSAPVVSGDRLVIHHRQGDIEVVTCLNANDGTSLWRFTYPTDYRDQFGFDNGPRATPSINEGRVYTFGAEGVLSCIDLESGALIWAVETREDYGADLGYFGLASSPLVWSDRVLIQIGGNNDRGIVAFDNETGELLWSATQHEAGYSSPIIVEIDNEPTGVFFTRDGVVGIQPGNGTITFEIPWRASINASVNAASPVVTGQGIFISASYGLGATMIQTQEQPPKQVWQGNDQLSNHYATSVYHDGVLVGFHGRVDTGGPTDLRAIDPADGTRLWTNPSITPGNLTLVNDTLLVLTQSGELIAGTLSKNRFEPTTRAQVLGNDVRAYPAFADGVFFARDKNRLIALDLGKEGKQP